MSCIVLIVGCAFILVCELLPITQRFLLVCDQAREFLAVYFVRGGMTVAFIVFTLHIIPGSRLVLLSRR